MLFVALWAALMTKHTASAENKKTILEHADLIEGGETPGPAGTLAPYRKVVGNVRFLHGKTTLQCDRGTDWPASERIDLDGRIIITDGSVEIRGDKGAYYTGTEIGELTGKARGQIAADSLTVKSAKAKLDQKKNELWLYGDAVAWLPGKQLSGDTIRVHLRQIAGKKRADTIEVRGQAFLTTRDGQSANPPLHDQLSGKTLIAHLDDRSRLRRAVATTRAKSLYHLYDKKKQPSGVNFSSGEKIRMEFIDGRLDRILVTGNPFGKEYPNRMRYNRDINLPGFSLRDHEKPVFGRK